MMPKTLYATTLDPRRRRLLKVEVPEDKTFITDQTINQLMGKDPQARFHMIMDGAQDVQELDI